MDARGITFSAGMALTLAVLWTPSAQAYIDGGTASMIFQMLIAGGLAAMLTMRSFWAQIKGFFASLGKNSPPGDEKP